MNIYLISQNYNSGYDTFDSAVVEANSVEEARRIHPYDDWAYCEERGVWYSTYKDEKSYNGYGPWASIDKVDVQLIGKSNNKTGIPGVVLASYNAG